MKRDEVRTLVKGKNRKFRAALTRGGGVSRGGKKSREIFAALDEESEKIVFTVEKRGRLIGLKRLLRRVTRKTTCAGP